MEVLSKEAIFRFLEKMMLKRRLARAPAMIRLVAACQARMDPRRVNESAAFFYNATKAIDSYRGDGTYAILSLRVLKFYSLFAFQRFCYEPLNSFDEAAAALQLRAILQQEGVTTL